MAKFTTNCTCPTCKIEIDDNDFLCEVYQNQVSVTSCTFCKKYIRGYLLIKSFAIFIAGGKCLEKKDIKIDSFFLNCLLNEMRDEIPNIRNWYIQKHGRLEHGK